MLDEFSVDPPAGFPDHPHRGFETVSCPFFIYTHATVKDFIARVSIFEVLFKMTCSKDFNFVDFIFWKILNNRQFKDCHLDVVYNPNLNLKILLAFT